MSDETSLVSAIGEAGLTAIASDIVNGSNRPSALREGVKRIAEAGGKLEIMAAELLYEIRKNDYWKSYVYKTKSGEDKSYITFDDFLDNEVPFGKRKSYYLLSIYEKFVIELKIPNERLKLVEWSKAAKIVDIINTSNCEDFLNLLPKMSVREIDDLVKAAMGKTTLSVTEKPKELPKPGVTVTPTEDGEATVEVKFLLFPAQADNLKAALEVAGFETGSDKPGHQLDMICTEFVSSKVIDSTDPAFALVNRLDRQLKNLERVYGIVISVEKAAGTPSVETPA